jgi:cytochrome c5
VTMKKLLLYTAVCAIVISAVGHTASPPKAEKEGTVKSITLPVIEVKLKEGEGVNKVETYCSICHTTGYIPMQPRFSSEKWSAIVHKMIVVFGAPVNEKDSKEIINYLSRFYGTGE